MNILFFVRILGLRVYPPHGEYIPPTAYPLTYHMFLSPLLF